MTVFYLAKEMSGLTLGLEEIVQLVCTGILGRHRRGLALEVPCRLKDVT